VRFLTSVSEVRRVKIVGNEYVRHELYVISLNYAVVQIVAIVYARKSVCGLSESNFLFSPQRKVV